MKNITTSDPYEYKYCTQFLYSADGVNLELGAKVDVQSDYILIPSTVRRSRIYKISDHPILVNYYSYETSYSSSLVVIKLNCSVDDLCNPNLTLNHNQYEILYECSYNAETTYSDMFTEVEYVENEYLSWWGGNNDNLWFIDSDVDGVNEIENNPYYNLDREKASGASFNLMKGYNKLDSIRLIGIYSKYMYSYSLTYRKNGNYYSFYNASGSSLNLPVDGSNIIDYIYIYDHVYILYVYSESGKGYYFCIGEISVTSTGGFSGISNSVVIYNSSVGYRGANILMADPESHDLIILIYDVGSNIAAVRYDSSLRNVISVSSCYYSGMPSDIHLASHLYNKDYGLYMYGGSLYSPSLTNLTINKVTNNYNMDTYGLIF